MRLSRVLAVAFVAIACLASTSFAADWALTADAPLSYTFDKPSVNQPLSGGGTGNWTHRSTSDVSGSKVLLIAPFHLGVGYEDYSVGQNLNIPNCSGGGPCLGRVNMNLQIADAVLDIPMRFLHLGLGYGTGQANVDIVCCGGSVPVHHATVSQTFVTLGIPLGMSWDVHLGYHWVAVDKKNFSTGPGQDNQLLMSGEMLSAGLRLNF